MRGRGRGRLRQEYARATLGDDPRADDPAPAEMSPADDEGRFDDDDDYDSQGDVDSAIDEEGQMATSRTKPELRAGSASRKATVSPYISLSEATEIP